MPFDAELTTLVRDFQRQHRLAVDGIAGVQTQIALASAVGGADAPLELRGRLAAQQLQGDAQGEGRQGRVDLHGGQAGEEAFQRRNVGRPAGEDQSCEGNNGGAGDPRGPKHQVQARGELSGHR